MFLPFLGDPPFLTIPACEHRFSWCSCDMDPWCFVSWNKKIIDQHINAANIQIFFVFVLPKKKWTATQSHPVPAPKSPWIPQLTTLWRQPLHVNLAATQIGRPTGHRCPHAARWPPTGDGAGPSLCWCLCKWHVFIIIKTTLSRGNWVVLEQNILRSGNFFKKQFWIFDVTVTMKS